MKIKVCGMANAEIMQQLANLPIDMLGFIFYPKSPRYVVGKINPEALASLPKHIRKAGVFVNASSETIIKNAETYQLDTIQLHGSETPEMCQELQSKGFSILKAFNLTKKNDYKAYAPYCDYFLFDTPSEKHGGTGEKFDWSLLNTYTEKVPFFLSGGIGPNDADEIKTIAHPYFSGIDINSKFEIEPGVKDYSKIERFLSQLKMDN